MLLNPYDSPDLTGSTIKGTCGGKHVSNWRALLRQCCVEACRNKDRQFLLSLRDKIHGFPIRDGSYPDEGHVYEPAIRMSIQRRSANDSLKFARDIAAEADVSFDITVYYVVDGMHKTGRIKLDRSVILEEMDKRTKIILGEDI